jgi:hypothetical protein
VTIAGADAPEAIAFTVQTGPLFTIGFQESGLRAGTTWDVVVNGAHGGGSLHGNTTVLWTNLTAGVYNYTPGIVTGYTTPAAGQINVSANATVNISYAGQSFSKFPISFTESGLPSSGTWSVAINGTTITPGSGTLTVSLANGSYSWGVASLPTGYAASPSGGVISVAGSAKSVAVTITATGTTITGGGSPAWTYLSTLAYVLIGVLALLVVIFLALAIMAGRRPPSSPPESWSSSSTTTNTDGGSTTTSTKGGNP